MPQVQYIEINGKKAFVSYLDDDFNPVDGPEQATMMHIIFENGRSVWAEPKPIESVGVRSPS